MFLKITAPAMALALAMTGPIWGQDDTATLLDEAVAAYQAGDTDTAVRASERALAAAETPAERFDALILFGDLRSAIGDNRAAYELFARAVELVEENDPDNIHALDIALSRQSDAAARLGRREEWMAIGERLVAINETANEPIWRFNADGSVTHRFTGFHCPANVDGFVRVELINFANNGTDVSCKYAVPDLPNPAITLHVYRTPGVDAQDAFDNAHSTMRRNFNAASRIEGGETIIGDIPVLYAIYRQGGATSGVWTHVVDGWTLKLRMTHYGELERDDMQDAAEMTFANAPRLEAHFAQCEAAMDGEGRFQPSDGPGAALELAMLMTGAQLASEENETIPADPMECFIGGAPFRPSGGTIQARITDDGELLDYRAYPVGRRDVYLEATANAGLAALFASEGGRDPAADPAFILREVGPDAAGVYGEFDEEPSPAAFENALLRILDGELEASVWLTTDEDGNMSINLGEVDAAAASVEPETEQE